MSNTGTTSESIGGADYSTTWEPGSNQQDYIPGQEASDKGTGDVGDGVPPGPTIDQILEENPAEPGPESSSD